MYYAYVLLSEKDQESYIGYTEGLKKWFRRHVEGLVPATASCRPLRLIFYEAYLKWFPVDVFWCCPRLASE